ncbi:MAG TPA: DUF1577 domain-containing protein [Leptospiraceae bacterium]|nr:DUF1577 domain-containing protein [Leptospiraceae bacterium]HNB97246.1 DUF1577 domain-containing protein [Leptospiraceae bacterium]HNI86742.1 DUF1577 domain-containing protein [Leptospiraceae bacterium]HNN78704.1 DUF1577 domain-containing protein [Leptospiraceae bacterium]
MEIIDRKIRETVDIKDAHKRVVILAKHLSKTEMQIKDTETHLKLLEHNADGTKIIVERLDPTYILRKGQNLILTKLLGRYVQLDCTILGEKPGNLFLLQINKFLVSSKERLNDRIHPPPEQVWVTNIRTSGVSIETNMHTIPTYMKINFTDYENKLRKNFDYIKIDIFKPDLEERFHVVKESGKTLYVANTQDRKCYTAFTDDDFIDLEEEYHAEINRLISMYKTKNIVSEIIMPVIYVNTQNVAIPFGYVHIQSRTKPIDHDQVMELKILTFEMIDRIRESNFILNTNKFRILDLSKSGLKIRVPDRELKQHLPHVTGFNCDIFFKMQSAINIQCEIRFIGRDQNDDMILGLLITGFREGDKEKFYSNFSTLQNTPKKPYHLP